MVRQSLSSIGPWPGCAGVRGVALLFTCLFGFVRADAAVVTLQGNISVSADTVSTGAFGTLSISPQVLQSGPDEWPAGTTLILRAPANFVFNAAQPVTATILSSDPAFDLGGGPGPGAMVMVLPAQDAIQFTVVTSGATAASSIQFSGIQLRAINCTGGATGDAADILITASAGDLIDASLVDVAVTPGVLDHYSLQASPSTQAAGSAITCTIRAEDTCNNGIPLLAVPADIAVTATGATGTLTFASGTFTVVDADVNDNAANIPADGNTFKGTGRGTFLVTSSAADGPVTIAITDGVRSANAPADWITAACSLEPPSSFGAIGGMHSVTVTALRNGVALTGVNVGFAVSSGPNAGAGDSVTTDANGQATFTYASNGATGVDMIGASGLIEGIPFSCTATQDWISLGCALDPPSSSGPVGGMHTVTATITRNLVPAPGVLVGFRIPAGPNAGQESTAATDSSGQAAFAYMSNNVPGEDTIRASGSIDGVEFQCTATRNWVQSSCSLEPPSAFNAVGTMHTVTMTLRRNGEPAMDVPVMFTVIGSGSPNAGAGGNGTTDANGEAAFTYTSNGTPGVDTIQGEGMLDGSPFSCTATKTWVQTSCQLEPATATLAINTEHNLTATLMRNGSPAAGIDVNFSVEGGPNSGVTGQATTDAEGRARFAYTGGGTAGTDLIRANGLIDSIGFSCTAEATWVDVGCSLAPPAAVNPAGGMHSSTLTLLRNGSPVENVAIAFSVTSGPNLGASGNGMTDAAGQASFAYTSNGAAGLDTIEASATVDGIPVTCTATQEWISPACSLEPAAGSGPVGALHMATVTVLRRPGVPAFPTAVDFAVTGGPNSGQMQSGVTTDDQGQATFMYVGSGGPGVDTVRASGTIEGIAFECTATQEWTESGCALTPASATRQILGTHMVSIEVRQNGLPVAGSEVGFQVSGVNSTSGMATTDAEGRANFSYTSNGMPGMDVIQAIPMLSGASTSCSASINWIDVQCALAPPSRINRVGTQHSVNLTLTRNGMPAPDVQVAFAVIGSSSPNIGISGNRQTNASGEAVFSFTGSGGIGTDTIQASGFVEGVPFLCTATTQWIQASCEVTPATSTGPTNSEHAVTVSVSRNGMGAGAGVPVVFEIVSGPNARPPSAPVNTDVDGRVMFTYLGGSGFGTDTIRTTAVVEGLDTVCTATRTWISTSCSLSQTSNTNLVGTTHSSTITVLRDGGPAANVSVDFQVVGTASPNLGQSANRTTNGLGQATFSYVGSGGIGTDTILATGNISGVPFSCTIAKTWITTGCTIAPPTSVHRLGATQTATLTLLRNDLPAANVAVEFAVIGSGAPNAGIIAGATTDAAGQAVFSYAGTGGAGTDTIRATGSIDGVPFSCTATRQWVDVSCSLTPTGGTKRVGMEHTVTCTLQRNGAAAPGVLVAFEITAGPNIGRSGVGTTNNSGAAVFTYTGDAGPGVDQIRASGMVDAVIPFECTATQQWTELRCVLSPESQTNPIQTTHLITLTLTRDGSPAVGIPAVFSIVSGPNAGLMGTRSTNSAGQAAFAYSGGATTGTDTILVSGSAGGLPFSCTATKRWITSSCTLLPATQTSLVGQPRNVVFSLIIDNGPAPAGVGVTFEVTSGPGTGQTFSTLTDSSSKASFAYSGTGAIGTDTIRSSGNFEGVPFSCTAGITWVSDDGDGVSPEVEAEGPNDGDGNSDGVPDNLQPNVASMPDVLGQYFTVESPTGTQLRGVEGQHVPAPDLTPADTSFPNGLLRFELRGLAPGGSAVVRILLHGGAGVNAYYKFGPTPVIPLDHYYRFTFDGTTGAEVAGNEIVLSLVDGARGDDDLAANGIIVEPGAPAVEVAPPAAPEPAPSTGCGACGAGASSFAPFTMLCLGLFGHGRSRRRRR